MQLRLFFDTETTGLPDNYKASYTNVSNWPRLVQLAWVLYNGDTEVSSGDYLVKPHGFIIPEAASDIHDHDHEKCMKLGVDLKHALNEFYGDFLQCDGLFAHNIDFDNHIVASELHRSGAIGHAKLFMTKPMFCTMKSSTEYCKLPGKYGFKWPKLGEMYQVLFDEVLENTHDAVVDIRATAKCYFELKKRGVFP